jgi:hypothetical protein
MDTDRRRDACQMIYLVYEVTTVVNRVATQVLAHTHSA